MALVWVKRIVVDSDEEKELSSLYINRPPQTPELSGLGEKTVLSGPCRTPTCSDITQYMKIEELPQLVEFEL